MSQYSAGEYYNNHQEDTERLSIQSEKYDNGLAPGKAGSVSEVTDDYLQALLGRLTMLQEMKDFKWA